MGNYFKDGNDSGVKSILRCIIVGIIVLVPSVGLMLLFTSSVTKLPAEVGDCLAMLSVLVCSIGGVYISNRFLDNRTFVSYGINMSSSSWWQILAAGLGAGFFGMGLIFLLLLASKCLVVKGYFVSYGDLPAAASLVLAVFTYAFEVLAEELLFRGFFLIGLVEAVMCFTQRRLHLSLSLAAVCSSLIWIAVVAALQPEAESVLALFFMFTYGVAFSFVVLYVESLSVSIGLHLSWNLCEYVIFAFKTSKGTDNGVVSSGVGIIESALTGPVWFTGGVAGPEGGFSGFFGMCFALSALMLFARITSIGSFSFEKFAKYPNTETLEQSDEERSLLGHRA